MNILEPSEALQRAAELAAAEAPECLGALETPRGRCWGLFLFGKLFKPPKKQPKSRGPWYILYFWSIGKEN